MTFFQMLFYFGCPNPGYLHFGSSGFGSGFVAGSKECSKLNAFIVGRLRNSIFKNSQDTKCWRKIVDFRNIPSQFHEIPYKFRDILQQLWNIFWIIKKNLAYTVTENEHFLLMQNIAAMNTFIWQK